MRPALLLLLVLLAGPAGAQQHTQRLGLQLGSQAYENQNWQVLDQAVCQKPGEPTLCVTGGVGAMPQAATAPFACSATTDGVYTDTTCWQVCACNPAQAKWCRSDTGACLSATDCC
jgi:hypothetical protein